MIYQSTHGPIRLLSSLETPVFLLRKGIVQGFDTISAYFHDKKSLTMELNRLKHTVQELQSRLQSLEELEEENSRLRELLNFSKRQKEVVSFARVISPLPDRYSGIVLINRGGVDGITKDMVVTTVNGLVGKVIEVMPRYSKVLLITDVNFSVSVKVKGTDLNGIVSGRGDRFCVLKYISKDETIQKGELLVTSGIDGVFPEGIPVGYIKDIYEGDNLFYLITVRPIVNIARIKEVILLKGRG
jgi:rod shape-determining protein MreC